jgi:hypothetical protein
METGYRKIGLFEFFEIKSFFNGSWFFLKRDNPYKIYRNKDGSVTIEQNGEGGFYNELTGTYSSIYLDGFGYQFIGIKADGSGQVVSTYQ